MQMRPAILALGLLATASCGTSPEIDPVARVSTHTRYKYEIEIHARVDSYGGPCNPTCFPTRIDDRHWIYVNRLEGMIPAEEMLLTYERGKFDFPQSALKGSVTIANDVLTVDLQRPYYKVNTVDHYTPYPYNGRFELRRRDAD
jgi:hypothetical protein